MRRAWLFPLILVAVLPAVPEARAQPLPGENIPAPVAGYPVFEGGWVHDFAGVLDEATETEIASTFELLEQQTQIDAVAVTIRSVADYQAGVSIEDFATGLFNAWELGDAGIDDGVLILVAVDDREARVTIGDGFDGSYVNDSDAVVETMIRYFRDGGDYAGGVAAGAREVAARFRSLRSEGGGGGGGGGGFEADEEVGVGEYDEVGDDGSSYDAWWWAGGIGATAFAGTGGALVARRIRPRKCGTCGRYRKRLKGHAAEEPHLDPGQEVEEQLNSVEYDVWHCASCDTAEVARYRRLFSRYHKCTSCGYKTLRTETNTIQAATTSSTGLARVQEDCQHCDYHHEYERTIPRIRVSSSSSSSSGSSSSSSRGPSGGGRSSGRGSSGKW